MCTSESEWRCTDFTHTRTDPNRKPNGWKGCSVTFDPQKRMVWLAKFGTLDSFKDWLVGHGVLHPDHELQEMWDHYISEGRIYRAVIHGRQGRKPSVRFSRRQPTCDGCGCRLPFDTRPAGEWQPGIRIKFLCPECEV